jgi:molecular chaperone HtpG
MKDMANLGGGMSFYRDLPTHYKVILNTNHKLIVDLSTELEKETTQQRTEIDKEIDSLTVRKENVEKELAEYKTEEEKPIEKKADLDYIECRLNDLNIKLEELYQNFGKKKTQIKQLIDLALLANGLLKGEALSLFIKRSVELMEQ